MEQPKKAKVSRSVKKEAATTEVAPLIPVRERKAADKPNPDARPVKVYVTESGLTIEEY
jgi:hypothetical protein